MEANDMQAKFNVDHKGSPNQKAVDTMETHSAPKLSHPQTLNTRSFPGSGFDDPDSIFQDSWDGRTCALLSILWMPFMTQQERPCFPFQQF